MTNKERDKVWEIVDSISNLAIELDILTNDLKKDQANSQRIETCHTVIGRLIANSALLESVAYVEDKSEAKK